MKKTLLSLLLLCTLGACNDNDGDYAEYMDFVTVETDATAAGYHFRMDDGKSLHPGDITRVGAYDAVQGQRALLYFSLLAERVEGFDYNAAIYAIHDIYTGTTRLLDDDELAALPDDPMLVFESRLRNGYLTLRVAYPVVDNSKHNFQLAIPRSAVPTAPDYLDAELRHDAGDDTPGDPAYCYISFPLAEALPLLEGRQGISLRIRISDDEVRILRIDAR